MTAARVLYFIDRGRDRPEGHRAPYHRHLICTDADSAAWQAGDTGDGATVWHRTASEDGGGWLLVRWRGLDIDYGTLVRGFTLPDGTGCGFYHHRAEPPWSLLPQAVWWSKKGMPPWLGKAGVSLPADTFSRQRVSEGAVKGYGRNRLARKPLVWPGEEVGQLADWLEEAGFAEAAAAFRAELLGGAAGAVQGELFGAAVEVPR